MTTNYVRSYEPGRDKIRLIKLIRSIYFVVTAQTMSMLAAKIIVEVLDWYLFGKPCSVSINIAQEVESCLKIPDDTLPKQYVKLEDAFKKVS